MGTDGLFDNVYEQDLKPCLVKNLKRKEDGHMWMENPTAAADCIGDFAYKKSKDKRYKSPFGVGAEKAGRNYQGGK